MAELWALRDGLILAKDLNFNSLIVELDVKSVVQLMNNNSANMLMEPLLTDCYISFPGLRFSSFSFGKKVKKDKCN